MLGNTTTSYFHFEIYWPLVGIFLDRGFIRQNCLKILIFLKKAKKNNGKKCVRKKISNTIDLPIENPQKWLQQKIEIMVERDGQFFATHFFINSNFCLLIGLYIGTYVSIFCAHFAVQCCQKLRLTGCCMKLALSRPVVSMYAPGQKYYLRCLKTSLKRLHVSKFLLESWARAVRCCHESLNKQWIATMRAHTQMCGVRLHLCVQKGVWNWSHMHTWL